MKAIASEYATAPISEPERALLDYAVKLTRKPWDCSEGDIAALRQTGWSDSAILDLNLVVAYFNFVNRIAEGLGVQLEASGIATR